MSRPYPALTITEKGERFIRAGHVWVYGEEVTEQSASAADGDIVDVFTKKGKWLGAGFFCSTSKIRVRIISHNTNDRFDETFFARRIRYALDYRHTVMGDDFSCCRLIFGEADSFPGFTVDRFEDVLVCEILSYGIDVRRDLLYRLLLEELKKDGIQIKAIYERSDSPLRAKEGLDIRTGYYPGEGLITEGDGKVTITENHIKYQVDYIGGQKTGFFLDQKYNRLAVAKLARDKNVLDCFTHTGAFALNAAAGGAGHVTAVDISQQAIDMSQRNAKENGLYDKMSFLCCDVFDLLSSLASEGKSPYDFIILDPPAFTKSASTANAAYKGYKEINVKAMKLLPRGGLLATCSCSHFMTVPMFEQMLREAATDAQISLRQIEMRQQAPDHPILWGVPETDYLKFYLFQVI